MGPTRSRDTAVVGRKVSHVPPCGALESGLAVVAGPATAELNTRFARGRVRGCLRHWGPGVDDSVAPSAESGVDQADSGVAVGSLVWRDVRKAGLVRHPGVILRRWGGPAVAASPDYVAAAGARTFGAVLASRSSCRAGRRP